MLVWLGVMVWFLADFAKEIETVFSAYYRKLLLNIIVQSAETKVDNNEERVVIIQPKHPAVVTADNAVSSPTAKEHVVPVLLDDPVENNIKQFDEVSYIAQGKLKEGEDAYKKFAFNQQASERFPSDRNVMDTRHYM